MLTVPEEQSYCARTRPGNADVMLAAVSMATVIVSGPFDERMMVLARAMSEVPCTNTSCRNISLTIASKVSRAASIRSPASASREAPWFSRRPRFGQSFFM